MKAVIHTAQKIQHHTIKAWKGEGKTYHKFLMSAQVIRLRFTNGHLYSPQKATGAQQIGCCLSPNLWKKW